MKSLSLLVLELQLNFQRKTQNKIYFQTNLLKTPTDGALTTNIILPICRLCTCALT